MNIRVPKSHPTIGEYSNTFFRAIPKEIDAIPNISKSTVIPCSLCIQTPLNPYN